MTTFEFQRKLVIGQISTSKMSANLAKTCTSVLSHLNEMGVKSRIPEGWPKAHNTYINRTCHVLFTERVTVNHLRCGVITVEAYLSTV